MKRNNPRFGCRRIAEQISFVFGVVTDKDVVRRVLAKHYHPGPGSGGPSWLTFLGHTKDSLWSVDLFRCESLILKTHWVMVAMDQFTRRIIGFTVHAGVVDGSAVWMALHRTCWRRQRNIGSFVWTTTDAKATVVASTVYRWPFDA